MVSSDIFVIVVVFLFCIIGFYKGLLKSVFGLISIIIAVVLAIAFYPVVADLLKPVIYEPVNQVISDSLIENFPQFSKDELSAGVVEELGFPEYLKSTIVKAMPDPNKLIPAEKIVSIIADKLTGILTAFISIVIIFIAVKLLLLIAKSFIDRITKLPVINKVDKFGGILLGLFEGIMVVYFIFAILTLFVSAGMFEALSNSINDSNSLAKTVYENNVILDWIALD